MKWLDYAACLGAADADDATGSVEAQHRFIKRYCLRCPVTQECGEYGLNWPGVYGGATKKKRADLASPARQPCGTAAAYRRHYDRGEQPCDPCREAHNAARAAA